MWSFDVFDTCLTRKYAVPTDVFLEVALRLKKQLLPELGVDYLEIFREVRVNSEALALKRAGGEETTLAEIWYEVKQIIPALDEVVGMSTELAAESDALVSVAQTLELLRRARTQFGFAVFISDSYLPSEFIETQLRKHNCLVDGDLCFVSSEFRETKRVGTLYHRVISTLGISPEKLTHYGDNIISDVNSAKSAGIKPACLQNALLNEREITIGRSLLHIDPIKSSVLIGAMRAARLEQRYPNEEAAQSLVANFIGPFLWILANWIVRRAIQDGVTKLFFFSRDCYALHRAVVTLIEKENLNIECKYLYVSRQALLLPAVTGISKESMPWLRRSWEKSRLLDIAGKLDLDVGLLEVALMSKIEGINKFFCLKTDSHWDALWSVLSVDPLRSQLLKIITERRNAALNYLRREGVLENARIGVVDLGWHQSCQSALTNLVRIENSNACILGYFLALADDRRDYMGNMPAQAIFHRSPHDRRNSFSDSEVFSRIPILEHVLNCAPHGSVHHYENNIEMAVNFLKVSAEEVDCKRMLYREFTRFSEKYIQPMKISDNETRDILSALLVEAVQKPDKKWANLLSAIDVADDQNNHDRTSMVGVLSAKSLILGLFFLRNPTQLSLGKNIVWPELSLIASHKNIRMGYGLLINLISIARKLKKLMQKTINHARNLHDARDYLK